MKTIVKKNTLEGRIEPFLLAQLKNEEYLLSDVDAASLLTWNRLDLGFKKLFLELRDKHYELARKIYWDDIRSHSLGAFTELGNDEKTGFRKFCEVFKKISLEFQNGDFDPSLSLVPLAYDGSVLNGAHRTAACLHHLKQIKTVETELEPLICDHNYFFDRAIPSWQIELAALKHLEYGIDYYIAFLWPSGKSNWDKTRSLFSHILYQKKIQLTLSGAFNLLWECYGHMDWIGSELNNYKGLHQKVIECFPNELCLEMIIFQSRDGIDHVRSIKEEIRRINSIGYSSVHITDTQEEAFRIGSYLLNDNGLHFIKNGLPRYKITSSKVDKIKKKLINNGVKLDDAIIDGSFVLELYGVREAKDIDYFFSDLTDFQVLSEFGCREEQLIYHSVSKTDLIYNPKYHFKVDGLKFVSLKQVGIMKNARGEDKDLVDVKLIAAMQDGRSIHKLMLLAKQKWIYARIKTHRVVLSGLVRGLKVSGLYAPVRYLFRRLRGLRR